MLRTPQTHPPVSRMGPEDRQKSLAAGHPFCNISIRLVVDKLGGPLDRLPTIHTRGSSFGKVRSASLPGRIVNQQAMDLLHVMWDQGKHLAPWYRGSRCMVAHRSIGDLVQKNSAIQLLLLAIAMPPHLVPETDQSPLSRLAILHTALQTNRDIKVVKVREMRLVETIQPEEMITMHLLELDFEINTISSRLEESMALKHRAVTRRVWIPSVDPTKDLGRATTTDLKIDRHHYLTWISILKRGGRANLSHTVVIRSIEILTMVHQCLCSDHGLLLALVQRGNVVVHHRYHKLFKVHRHNFADREKTQALRVSLAAFSRVWAVELVVTLLAFPHRHARVLFPADRLQIWSQSCSAMGTE
jgi:hypothetical protein